MKRTFIALILSLSLIGLSDFSLLAADGDLLVNGKVGIGTTVPDLALHVKGPSSGISLESTYGTNAKWWILPLTNDATKLFRIYDPEASADRLDITSSGNVGIGTSTPSQILSIQTGGGGSWMSAGDSVNSATPSLFGSYGTGAAAIYTQSTYPISFYTNTVERMRIGATGGLSFGPTYATTDPGSGNVIISGIVGIGTTNPVYPIDVVGDIRLTGNLIGGCCGNSDVRWKKNIEPIGTCQ